MWEAPAPLSRLVSCKKMFEDISLQTWVTDTYRVDRVIEAATSKRGTAMFRELTFFLCDGHQLTTFERSQILTELRWTGWQCQEFKICQWERGSREHNMWRDEVRTWGYRPVILSTRKHFPLGPGPYVEIESLLEHGPAMTESFLVKIYGLKF
jgi:hypothetical protein